MVKWNSNKKIAKNMLETIGRTPLVRLNNIPKKEKINADVFGKIEWFSPTGSLKDRIYYEMITNAIKDGDLKPGMEILETSTGNAGIACSFVGRLLGYKVTVVMPEGMSEERKKLLERMELIWFLHLALKAMLIYVLKKLLSLRRSILAGTGSLVSIPISITSRRIIELQVLKFGNRLMVK